MESNQAYRVPTGRLAGSVVLALVVGALLPLLAVLQISLLLPVLMLGGIFAAHLKARAGWVPVGALGAAALAAGAWFMGGAMTAMLFAASLLPSLAVMRGMALKRPFFEQLKTGVAAFGAGLLAAMLIAYASFGGGMVARFADLLRSEFVQMPDSALQPLADAVNSALSLGGMQGYPTFTVEMYRASLSGILDLMQQTYAQSLPGTLLSGALLSGVLAVLWGNWTMARQGLATNESFVGMSRWFLPGGVTVGALALWALGFALANSGYASGATVYYTISQFTGAAFAIQALAALDRRMLAGGRSLTRRRVLITLLAVAALLLPGFSTLLCAAGVVSALFGSHGAARQWMKNHQDNNSDPDDPDE